MNKSFNNNFYSAYLWKKLKMYKEKKGLSFMDISKKLDVSRSYIANLFNWKNAWTKKSFKRIADAMWVNEAEFENMAREAKIVEYEHSTWETLSEKNNDLLSHLPKDVVFAFRNEGNFHPDDIKQIVDFIDFKRKERNNQNK